MLKVTQEAKGKSLILRVSGNVTEECDLLQIFGTPKPFMEFYCREIGSINSIGVKWWLAYFQSVHESGSQVIFHECSISMVEQFNMISNFTAGARIESFYAPFSCRKCTQESVSLFKTDTVDPGQFDSMSLKCENCGGEAVFDDDPEGYFYFLKYARKARIAK